MSGKGAVAPFPLPHNPAAASRRRRLLGLAVGATSVFSFLLLWELLTRSGVINPAILPSPLMTTTQFVRLLTDGTLMTDILMSSSRVITGFLLSASIAIPLGIAAGASRFIKAVLDPILSIIRPLPSLSWIPLSILWFGIGEGQKYSIVFMGTFAPLLVFVVDATMRVDKILIKAARNLGASPLEVAIQVLLPGALPSILSGLKVTLAISWACIISAEMVGASNGLGFLIWSAKDWGNISQVLVGMLMISATVIILDASFKALQVRLLPWLRNEDIR